MDASSRNFVTPTEFATLAGISRQAATTWCRKHGLGWRVGRNWRIDPAIARDVIAGKRPDLCGTKPAQTHHSETAA
jgi:hypothetical protein